MKDMCCCSKDENSKLEILYNVTQLVRRYMMHGLSQEKAIEQLQEFLADLASYVINDVYNREKSLFDKLNNME